MSEQGPKSPEQGPELVGEFMTANTELMDAQAEAIRVSVGGEKYDRALEKMAIEVETKDNLPSELLSIFHEQEADRKPTRDPDIAETIAAYDLIIKVELRLTDHHFMPGAVTKREIYLDQGENRDFVRYTTFKVEGGRLQKTIMTMPWEDLQNPEVDLAEVMDEKRRDQETEADLGLNRLPASPEEVASLALLMRKQAEFWRNQATNDRRRQGA